MTARNFTIDDDFKGDSNMNAPDYFPPDGWAQGNNCPTCGVQPDPSRAFNGTWNDSSCHPGNFRAVSFSFNGTAVYVYCILSNDPRFGPISRYNFKIDTIPVGHYEHIPNNGSELFEYNTLVYSNPSLQMGEHRFDLIANCNGNDSILTLFDYAIYTTFTPLDQASSTSDYNESQSTFSKISGEHVGATATTNTMNTPTSATASQPQSKAQNQIRALPFAIGILTGVVVTVTLSYILWYFLRKKRTWNLTFARRSTGQPEVESYPFASPSTNPGTKQRKRVPFIQRAHAQSASSVLPSYAEVSSEVVTISSHAGLVAASNHPA